MRPALYVLCVVLTTPEWALASRIDVAGTVYCRPTEGAPETPAGNVLVQVSFGSPIGDTFSQLGDGYYRIEVTRNIVDHTISLRYLASSDVVQERYLFVSREQLKRNERIPTFVVHPSAVIVADCSHIEPIPPPTAAKGGPGGAGAAATAAGAALAPLFGLLSFAAAAAGPGEVVKTEELPLETISGGPERGGLTAALNTLEFEHFGFRYAAARATAVDVVVNAASGGLEDGSEIDVAAGTELLRKPRRWHGAGRHTLGNGLMFGVGYFFQRSSAPVTVTYDGGKTISSDNLVASDHLLVPAIGKRFGTLSVALSGRILIQREESAAFVKRETIRTDTVLDKGLRVADTLITRRNTDVSSQLALGLAWQATPAIRIGAGTSNIFGAEERYQGKDVRNRTVGLGVAWFNGRWHLGADLEHGSVTEYTGSLGASVALPLGFELSGGYLTYRDSLRAGVAWKGVRYSVRRSEHDGYAHYIGTRFRW